VAKDDLPNESMKTDKAMEFDTNKEILDNVGIDSEVQKGFYPWFNIWKENKYLIAWLKTLPG
jgi:hypothetical protein